MSVCLLIAALVAPGVEKSVESDILEHLRANRPDAALALVDRLLESEEPAAGPARRALEGLRARSLFELGDYPAAEKQLRALIEGASEDREKVELLARLAQTFSFQHAHDEAVAAIDKALGRTESPALHRIAVGILLRARRYADIRAHAKAYLAVRPREPFGHFALGIALARSGEFEAALRELSWGLRMDGARRDAHFEIALVEAKLGDPEGALGHLFEILKEDPYDQEAAYQASRQLILTRRRPAMQTAAHLVRYFETVRDATGPSSRDHHFQAAGDGATAALLRASKWNRLAAYDRAIAELRRAETVGADRPEVMLFVADFWARMGLLAEARAAIQRLEEHGRSLGGEAREGVDRARAEIASRLEALAGDGEEMLAKASLRLASTRWREAGTALEALLAAAVEAGKDRVADRAARLLLALAEPSAMALEYLVERTREPDFLPLHIHYLARLAELKPNQTAPARRLEQARKVFLGGSSAGAGSSRRDP